ncbi:MAG: PHP domain-containing protein [Nitrospirota bacterium]
MAFKIDLHVHSKYSEDNTADPEEMVIRAIDMGLDAIAFTEHYYYEASEPAEGLKERYSGRISIFRGVEYSSAEGHCLIFGLDTDRLALNYAPVEDIIKAVNKSGGVVIPSHPYRTGSSMGDTLLRINGICALEGHNGCNMRLYNSRAVETARMLNLPYTGGSDAHSAGEVGSCYTVFQDTATDDNLIELLKNGNYQGIDVRKSALPFMKTG